MAATKKPSPAQLAARAKFTAMVKAKAAARKKVGNKPAAKKTATKKVGGLDKVVKKEKKTMVHYSRLNGIELTKKQLVELRLKSEKAVDYANDMGRYFTTAGKKSIQTGFELQGKCYQLLEELKIHIDILPEYTKKMYEQAKNTYNYWKK